MKGAPDLCTSEKAALVRGKLILWVFPTTESERHRLARPVPSAGDVDGEAEDVDGSFWEDLFLLRIRSN